MTFPASLPQPSLRAYPFMSLILTEFDHDGRCSSHSIAHIESDEIAGMAIEDRVDGNAPPRFVPLQGVDALLAISDETLGRLAKAIGLRMNFKTPLVNKAELAAQCAEMESEILDCFGDFTETHDPEQAQVWHLSARRGQLDVHWGALADVYNGCDDDQKNAITNLFEGCFGFSLESFYTIHAPEITLPTELIPVIQVEQRAGVAWCLNGSKDTWQREDVYQNQFLIEGRSNTNFDGHALIATASTLHEAISLATVYTATLTEAPGFSRISITEQEFQGYSSSKMHMVADLQRIGQKGAGYKGRLSWDLDRLEKPLSVESTFKTLLNIEKSAGVKWAQAVRLEHDLGM